MTFLALAAFLSLRRMSDVVLKARLYLNHRRLFVGFLYVALSMVTILVLIVVQLGLYAVDTALPSSIGVVGLGVSFVLLALGLYNFYALVRTPPGASRETA